MPRLLPYFPNGLFDRVKLDYAEIDKEKESRKAEYYKNQTRGYKAEITRLKNQLMKKGK